LAPPDWTGIGATRAWDGTGSPGDADPFVDTIVGALHHGFAFGEPTTDTLDKFADAFNATNATVHACPPTPESSRMTTVDGIPARVDALHCRDSTGVFALTAYVVSGGRAYVFTAYDRPGQDAAVRDAFNSLLAAITFDK
jgi:hypothetical protein